MMRVAALLWLALLVGGCATAPAPPAPDRLFDDAAFHAPANRPDPSAVFAMTPAMRAYLDAEIQPGLGSRQALIAALYRKGGLKLEYDTGTTRNAAEAFDARAGNCLSLVIMTAAFAKAMGIPVRYQTVYVEDTWSRSGDLYLAVGHVNLSLGGSKLGGGYGYKEPDAMVVDFLPGTDLARARMRTIAEETIVAMYMNNRAVESLAQGRHDDAYAFAREAIRQDPRFLAAYTTLGAIYERHGDAELAHRAYAYVLDREPANAGALSNLVGLMRTTGHPTEADALARRLAEIEPEPPFAFYARGIEAMRAGQYRAARDLFRKEVERAAYYHEFHFWLAAALLALGETADARRHMAIAIETSTTAADHALYEAKMARLRAPVVVR